MSKPQLTPSSIGLKNTQAAVHFIAIGGIGMSALAEVLLDAGIKVQGSDAKESANTQRLRQKGATVYVGHAAEQVHGAGLVVVSTAIKATNPELLAAKAQGLEVIHRGVMLGRIVNTLRGVCMAATHGKTTTTALTFTALNGGGLEAGIINGGVLPDIGTNAKLGNSTIVAVESDESDQSFLQLTPETAVIMNIEPEHLEHYDHKFENQIAAYGQFAAAAKQLVACVDDPLVEKLAQQRKAAGQKVVTYGFAPQAEIRGENISFDGLKTHFDVVAFGQPQGRFTVNLPGKHYVQNAVAALTVAHLYGVPMADAAKPLATFGGVGRRFNIVGHFNGAPVVDDYGHHPTEIKATIAAARNGFKGKVYAVIEPHRYTRLSEHMEGFASCAQVADVVLIAPVYSAGEDPIEGASQAILAQKAGAHMVNSVTELKAELQNVTANDVIMMLGAGNISAWAYQLVEGEKHAI